MISRIRGTLVACDPGTIEVMTEGGVSYEIEIPLTAYERLPAVDEHVELRTHQVVREDALTLYGFIDDTERRVFRRLLTASGVGPRLALNMLSTMPPERLVDAIRGRDIPTLRQIPGLGTKKAERLSVELADRLDDLVFVAAVGSDREGSKTGQAVNALIALGYPAADARSAVQRVQDRESTEGVALIKAALAELRG